MKKFRASVVGATGYGGSELLRRLLRHPHVELARAVAIDHVGEPLAAVHPNLEGQSDLRFENIAPAEAARGVDILFLALPHRVTALQVPALLQTGVKVIDMSGDFRISDPAVYARYYGGAHPFPELLAGTFVYGLPEVNRDRIRAAQAVASPGCFATAIELGLLPLAQAGLLAGRVATVGVTGSSGSGAAPSPGTHHPVRSVNLRTYKPLEHQHVPEMEELLTAHAGRAVHIDFVPVSAPLSRGIFATSFVTLAAAAPADVERAFASAYVDCPFVRQPRQRLPEVIAVAGSNYAEVGFHAAPCASGGVTVTCFSALDNLMKGGAGQALQNMNLMLGLDERTGLDEPGVYP